MSKTVDDWVQRLGALPESEWQGIFDAAAEAGLTDELWQGIVDAAAEAAAHSTLLRADVEARLATGTAADFRIEQAPVVEGLRFVAAPPRPTNSEG